MLKGAVRQFLNHLSVETYCWFNPDVTPVRLSFFALAGMRSTGTEFNSVPFNCQLYPKTVPVDAGIPAAGIGGLPGAIFHGGLERT